jgi:hypothetical protein
MMAKNAPEGALANPPLQHLLPRAAGLGRGAKNPFAPFFHNICFIASGIGTLKYNRAAPFCVGHPNIASAGQYSPIKQSLPKPQKGHSHPPQQRCTDSLIDSVQWVIAA